MYLFIDFFLRGSRLILKTRPVVHFVKAPCFLNDMTEIGKRLCSYPLLLFSEIVLEAYDVPRSHTKGDRKFPRVLEFHENYDVPRSTTTTTTTTEEVRMSDTDGSLEI